MGTSISSISIPARGLHLKSSRGSTRRSLRSILPRARDEARRAPPSETFALPRSSTRLKGSSLEWRKTGQHWLADRSPPGTQIAAGDPLCTVLAEGKDIVAARVAVAARAREAVALFLGKRSDGHESAISVNRLSKELADALKRDAAVLKIAVRGGSLGETLIDAGATARGSVSAGLRIAEICLGGLGVVRLSTDQATPRWPWAVEIASPQPVIACLGCQYAGWSLSHEKFFALGSGPARALAQKETVLKDIGYCNSAESTILVIESGAPPPPEVIEKVAADCHIAPSGLTVVYAPTQSLAGGAQVVARVLEVALHKAHELKFPLDRIIDGMGAAPLSPPHPNFVTAMGRTNDAIIYGGRVQLFVTGPMAKPRIWRTLCRVAPRETTGPRSPISSNGSRAISTPSIRCYSARLR